MQSCADWGAFGVPLYWKPWLKPLALICDAEFKTSPEMRHMLGLLTQAESGHGSATVASIETLSDREIEVLRAMREGKSNKEIAVTLFVAPSTVKTHLKNIFAKMGVSNRTRAVTMAEEAGLLE
jgi:DNA-binding NarL/FixJ family response regulator